MYTLFVAVAAVPVEKSAVFAVVVSYASDATGSIVNVEPL